MNALPPAINSSEFLRGHGEEGQSLLRQMDSISQAHSRSITYNEVNDRLTIHNTSGVDGTPLQEYFLRLFVRHGTHMFLMKLIIWGIDECNYDVEIHHLTTNGRINPRI